MRILFTSQPGMGHLNGLIVLAQEFKRRGHTAIVAGAPSVVAAFQAAGIDGHVVIEEPDSTDSPSVHARLRSSGIATPAERLAWTRSEISVRERATSLAPKLRQYARSLSPDLMVRDATELAGWVVAETLGVPHVSLEVSAHWSIAAWDSACGPAVSELREAVGLPVDSESPSSGMYDHAHLTNAPVSLVGEVNALPSTNMFIAPEFFESTGRNSIPDLRFADRHIYMAFGSVYGIPRDIYEDIVSRASRIWPVVAVGSHRLTSSVYRDAYIPQSTFMSNCRAVFCHAGRSTVLTALTSSVPVICAPIASDHHDVARAVERVGAGVSVPWDAGEVLQSLEEVAREDSGAADRCRDIAEEIADLPSPGEIADWLIDRFSR
ncbi:glycosyltransferase [Streptomyces kutzneri]|uniref:glycosyltransferase n=1 Tax=Streptomyces kutzneri TaxID=3051179 RepID=UPI0028D7E2F4|nr:nucleotide disphospho-sugar-binding domain-containing protein [Streptomyces sp. DSM 40907]